jgi:hypothetical protein
VAIGQAHDAEREAFRQQDPGAVRNDELGGAAADVDEKQRVLARGKLAPQREIDQPRLFLAGDDLDAHARALLHGFDELLGVGRLADGAGGDRPDDLGAGAAGELDEVLDGRSPRLDRLGREQPGPQRLAAQAHHGLLPQQDLEGPVLLHVGDQQLDAVGADVDGGERSHRGGILASHRRNGVKAV